MSLNALPNQTDILVVGGGNAGLNAAISARLCGKQVVLLESAVKALRGGNSRHTRNLRIAHDKPLSPLINRYTSEQYYRDILDVTGGNTNTELTKVLVAESTDIFHWLKEQGVLFQSALSGTLNLAHSNAFFLGGGKSLMNALYRRAEDLGVKIIYSAQVVALTIENKQFRSATVAYGDGKLEYCASAVIVASGGFQSNIDWLQEIWGESANNFIIRGTQNNTGLVLKSLLKHRVKPVGELNQCHAVACDARANKFDDGIISRFDGICFSIVVNKHGARFYDEGEDIWPKRYAIWGRLIAQQPDQLAYAILDSKVIHQFMPSPYREICAPNIDALEQMVALPKNSLQQTIQNYHRHLRIGTYNPQQLDDCRTEGLTPPKSHWALPIDQPPFYAFPLKAGITFTYYGVTVNDKAQVQYNDGSFADNIFACGEVMAGNILGQGYCAGTGLTIGAVFGKRAGEFACS